MVQSESKIRFNEVNLMEETLSKDFPALQSDLQISTENRQQHETETFDSSS